jgi:hypothetical protein
MTVRSRTDLLAAALDQLITHNISDVSGAAVITTDGMLLSARMSPHLASSNAERVSAIAATMMGVTSRVVGEIKIGKAEEAIIRAEQGYLIVMPIAQHVVLSIILRAGANLGLLRLDAREISRMLVAALSRVESLHVEANNSLHLEERQVG